MTIHNTWVRMPFSVGKGVARGARGRPYERQPDDPLHRPLRIYTVDPGTRQEEGAIAVAMVPWEPLEEDFRGHVFRVMPVLKRPAREDVDEQDRVDLDDPRLMLCNGRSPSPVDPRFHQQMVYAVASLVYASFQRALGRHVAWASDPHEDDGDQTRLRLRPHGRRGHAGASYNRKGGEILFGFIQTENEPRGRAAPNGHTFACVSHDIVAHEVTHALLDGLRAHFLEPTSADVLGFHEGFADVIALLHRYSYKEVVRAAIRGAHGRTLRSQLLTSIAREFGLNTGNGDAVRRVEVDDDPRTPEGQEGLLTYREDLSPHEMGRVFLSAVLHAFATVHVRKIERYLRMSTAGSGVLPTGDVPPDLLDVLVEEATQLAGQFLNVCIRAIDYCPPVDLQLGDFLRAVITADMDLVPEDPWGYREAWIDSFALHRIFPRGVQCMSEDSLRWDFIPSAGVPSEWPADEPQKLVVEDLSFRNLQFDGDPARAPSREELERRAEALGRFVLANPDTFGILLPEHPHLDGDDVTLPEVQSIRTSRRVGPDGQVVFDLVAEVTHTRKVQGEYPFLFRGGCTVILGPRGEVRYIIAKSVGQNSRVFRQRKFMQGAGEEFVSLVDDWYAPDAEMVQFAHQHD